MSASVITKLTDEKKQELKDRFLKGLGDKLKMKREKINLSQQELADCLEVDQTTLSKYEKGTRDMNVSLLALFSVYCKFPMSELFPKEESKLILDTFSKAVNIVAANRKMQLEKEKYQSNDVLEDVPRTMFQMQFAMPRFSKQKSLKEQYKDCDIKAENEAFSDEEFCDYVRNNEDIEINTVISAGQFLIQLDNNSEHSELKTIIADYIVDEMVIERAVNTRTADRAYAYYKALFKNKLDS